MEKVNITTEFIKLDQFLKWAGVADYGTDAKIMISEGKVKVNDAVEFQRGKKLRKGDIVETGGKKYLIEKE